MELAARQARAGVDDADHRRAEDDRVRERSEYNESALAEAERAGDTAAIERLLLERRQINETRRSIDRRREHTRLLARPIAAAQT